MKGRKQPVTVGCLFAAIGGFCKAFQQKGATILWANDKDKFAAETFRLNFPDMRYIEKPVEELSAHGDRLPPVDVLTAGFPCQAFSIAGEKRGFDDPRGLLFLHIMRIIKEFGKNKPKVLLLENVKNLKAHDKGRTFKRIQGEGGHNQPVIKDRWGIRKLTPRECARLQGYEDSWFKIPGSLAVDTPRSRYSLAASQSPDGPPETMRCI